MISYGAMNSGTPVLNWRELSVFSQICHEKVEGLFLDRIIVPERPRFPSGYLKGEWVLRFTGRKKECSLLMSVRPRHPYLALIESKGPKAASQATHSAFDLTLSKQLKGAKLLALQALPRERTVILWFSHPSLSQSHGRIGLALNLIPATPEALLVSVPSELSSEMMKEGWPILARSRPKKSTPSEGARETKELYFLPDGSKAPDSLPLRDELVNNPRGPEVFYQVIEKELEYEAFQLRLKTVEKKLKELLKLSLDRIHQCDAAIQEAKKDTDWQIYADALKNSLGHIPECIPDPKDLKKWVRIVPDYIHGGTIQVPCEPQLSPTEQVEKFYQLSRRKNRRIEEASARQQSFQENRIRFETMLKSLAALSPQSVMSPFEWGSLEVMERAAHITLKRRPSATVKGDLLVGKSFTSKEGSQIFVGRNKIENLELTFKKARGNDVWMHVRGRPGAHVLIPVPSGKSVSLETLLDGANLCIYYSGGENWGKTEVDYTFKKYVKRIKDSSEASYTHNKTLLIEPDPTRLKRLLTSEDLGKIDDKKKR